MNSVANLQPLNKSMFLLQWKDNLRGALVVRLFYCESAQEVLLLLFLSAAEQRPSSCFLKMASWGRVAAVLRSLPRSWPRSLGGVGLYRAVGPGVLGSLVGTGAICYHRYHANNRTSPFAVHAEEQTVSKLHIASVLVLEKSWSVLLLTCVNTKALKSLEQGQL